ncbi:PAS domain S-box protein [Streptomyces sp. NPDC015131]|uniref:PAS domain S-box protein n=1 Tax=Streptomyces sp. NPDC015131 TaxID=3364941 RepID=UPI0037018944
MHDVLWRNRALLIFDRMPVPVAVCQTDGEMLLANPAMAAEWGSTAGRLPGRNVLELFHPRSADQVHRIEEAVRRGHRSRYPLRVDWTGPDGRERYGELTADTVSDSADAPLCLLVVLKVLGDREAEPATGTEKRILALVASGATTDRIARSVGLTADGVNYHLTRLSRRWGVPGRTALVARAYVLGVLSPDVWPPAAAPDQKGPLP